LIICVSSRCESLVAAAPLTDVRQAITPAVVASPNPVAGGNAGGVAVAVDDDRHWPVPLQERHVHASLLWCAKQESTDFFVSVAPRVWQVRSLLPFYISGCLMLLLFPLSSKCERLCVVQVPVLTPMCCQALLAHMTSVQPLVSWANTTLFPTSSTASNVCIHSSNLLQPIVTWCFCFFFFFPISFPHLCIEVFA
jgi:hypothetical protein